MNKRVTRSAVLLAATGTAVATLAAVLSVPAPARAEKQVALPAQASSYRMGDGTVITLNRNRERARVVGSMGGTPAHRAAWVSGKYTVRVSRDVVKIEVQPGYIVGCQVNFSGADSSGDEGDADAFGGGIDSLGAGESVHLGPGQAAQFNINDTEYADDFGAEKHDPYPTFTNTRVARFSYVNAQLGLTGCAGYAQARSTVRVMVETDFAMQTVNFYGRPFSIG
ncbi:hypothetical protein GCM10010528_01030 [Gordonia defluvii]|uniref:MspA protein n=1 Tax=Gordonia defluvii TaxID=283718 RepID=A0ABN3YF06_9ACTN|nr:MspA family porin [Gordonia sp. UBA5067]